jgi:hypothetical protein
MTRAGRSRPTAAAGLLVSRAPQEPSRVLVLVATSLAVACLSACSSASTDSTCDCAASQIAIDVPADIASSVTVADVHLSGPGCADATVTCGNSTNGCTAYDFTPTAAGECDLEVDKPSGVFTSTLTILTQSGCCASMFTAAITTVDVPEPEDGG